MEIVEYIYILTKRYPQMYRYFTDEQEARNAFNDAKNNNHDSLDLVRYELRGTNIIYNKELNGSNKEVGQYL